jgi:hypothetical protein
MKIHTTGAHTSSVKDNIKRLSKEEKQMAKV